MTYNSVFKSGLFAGQSLIVTGGGSGIGRCVAHELTALGARVALVGRTQDELDGVAAEIAEEGGEATTHRLDIREEASIERVVGEIVATHGAIHGLVNNAGGQFPSPLAGINQKGFETVVGSNLVGGFLMAKAVYNQSMHESGGAIVNIIADMWSGMPTMGHSGAARAGMLNLTETAVMEWAISGVRVNAVAPGWFASSGLDTYTDPTVKAMIPKLRGGVPIKRLATGAEVSSAITWLLSPGAAYANGTCIKVDGGSSCDSRGIELQEHANSHTYDGFHRAVTPEAIQG